RYVHHDVNEEAFGCDERAKIPTGMIKPKGECAASRDQNIAEVSLTSQVIPRKIRIQEDESQIVHAAVKLLRFEEARILFGILSPFGVKRVFCQKPHHAGVKSGAPICPALTVVSPATILGVNWKIARIALDRRAYLLGREINGVLQPRNQ